MTPEQKIKWTILLSAMKAGAITTEEITLDKLEALWDANTEDYQIQESIDKFRHGGIETKLAGPYSRHYESKEVAAKVFDGSWAGWTYWYGGGKHGEPSAIEWMDSAYALNVTERQEMVTVRDFVKALA